MKKILFFIHTLQVGGAERVLCNLVNAMDQKTFDITVQTIYQEDPGAYLREGIHYRYCYGPRKHLRSLQMRAEAMLGLTYPLRIRDDYDIEVAYLECGTTKIMAASTNRKAVKIAWVHCDVEKLKDAEKFRKKSARYYQKYDRIICVSQSVRESFLRMFGDQPPVEVLYNVNDEDEILKKALAFPVDHDAPALVSVGRLYREKGYDRLLTACGQLKRQGLRFRLQILGEGPERENLEAQLRQEQLSDCVRLVGFQENPYPYLKNADAVVCASRYEGLSTVVTEALILGKPVVTTPCAGMQELLGDSAFGLITGDSAGELAEGLRRMLTDHALRAHYAQQAQLRGKSFSKAEIVGKTQELFEQLLLEKQQEI